MMDNTQKFSSNDMPVGIKPIPEMTDREIAEETLYWLREAGKALAHFQNGGMTSIMSMMGGLFGGKGKA